jgi:hypothetical protein
MGYLRGIYELPMRYLRGIYGVPKGYLWFTYGVPKGHLWGTYGLSTMVPMYTYTEKKVENDKPSIRVYNS